MSLLSKTPKARRKAEEISDRLGAVLAIGPPGAGKTRLIGELLLRNHTILLIHCGLGAPGTDTIRSYLQAKVGDNKASELLKGNFRQFWVQDSEELLEIGNEKWPRIKEMFDDTPENQSYLSKVDHLVIEELNSGQSMYEMDTVPKEKGIPNPTAVNDTEGAAFGHFRRLEMSSNWITKGLMRIESPHRPLRIVVTAHESDKVKCFSSTGHTGPAMATKAAGALVGACSYVFGCKRVDGLSSKTVPTWKYTFSASNALFRMRGEGWPVFMTADPAVLWDCIEGKLKPKDIPKDLLP